MAEGIAPSSNTFEWQLVGPIAPYATLGTIYRVLKSLEVKWSATMPTLSVAHYAMLLGTPSPNIHEKVIIYWNLLWDVPPGWRSYFTFLSEGGLLNLWGDPLVQLKAGHVETHYPWNGTYTTESGRRVGVMYWHIPPAVHSLMPHNTHLANMYGMYHQVKFLKLTTSISSRSGGQCSVFYWYDHLTAISLFPHWPGQQHIT